MDVDYVAVGGEDFTEEAFNKIAQSNEKKAAVILEWFMAARTEQSTKVKAK